MKKKNLKKAFNKRINFALFLGIAASFSPLIVMGSCNSKSSQPRNNKDGDGNQNGGNGDSPDIPSKSKFEKLSDKVSLVTKVSKRESAFKDYEFKNTEMTLSDFASIFNLDISAAELTEYKNIKLIINKDKGASKVIVKLKDTNYEKTINISIDSFITLEEYFSILETQLQRYNFSLNDKDDFLNEVFQEKQMAPKALASNLKVLIPDDLFDKDVILKITKKIHGTKVEYNLSTTKEPEWAYSFEVEIKKFIKSFKNIKWHKFPQTDVRKHPELLTHQEGYYINYDDNEKKYLLDRKSARCFNNRTFLMRSSTSFDSTSNQFISKNQNKTWQYNGFTDLYWNQIHDDTVSDGFWVFNKQDVFDTYCREYFDRKHIDSSLFYEDRKEFSSILTSNDHFALSNFGWYGSIFVITHFDPTKTDPQTAQIELKSKGKGAWDIFLMPGHEHNNLTHGSIPFPPKDKPEEQDMYLTTARGMDIDADKLIFVSNSGMISVTNYDLNVLPNIEVQNLLSDSEKNKYYEVQRKNFNSVYENKYDREADYYSIDFISSTFKSLSDNGYTFMYWKNHNALSNERNYAGFKDIYPDKKELYQVTLDKDFKIKENKKVGLPAITLTYEDYKRKEKALSTNALVNTQTEQDAKSEATENKIEISIQDIMSKLNEDVSSISASDVTNYFKTSIVDIGGKKYFYLADEKMTKILVMDNNYQPEKTIDIPIGAFKKLEEADGHKRYITKMFKKDNNLILFSNFLETLVIDSGGNVIKEPKANYSADLAKYRNTIFQNPYKNTEIFQLDEDKYLVFMHQENQNAHVYDRITKIAAVVDADGQFEIDE